MKILLSYLFLAVCLLANASLLTAEDCGTQDDDVFYLLEQNIINLDTVGTSDAAAQELANLLDEGYVIDARNMTRLIGLLDHANPCDNATTVILRAIEYRVPFTAEHITFLIMLLDHANPRGNVTKILTKAIVCKVSLNQKHLAALIALLARANPSDSATAVLLKAIECDVKFGPKERFFLAETSKMAGARTNVEKVRKALHDKKQKIDAR